MTRNRRANRSFRRRIASASTIVPTSGNQPPDPSFVNVVGRYLAGFPFVGGLGFPNNLQLYEPSLFNSQVSLVTPNTATSVNVVGNAVTSTGTLSTPAATEGAGSITGFATAATANATSGTGNSLAPWFISTPIGALGGFLYSCRLFFPDASYNESGATTGSRIFVGLTSGTMAASVGADDSAGHRIGFSRVHNNAGRRDTNWQISTKDNITESLLDTGLVFLSSRLYQFILHCQKGDTIIGWRIENLTDNTFREGTVSIRIPASNAALRAGFQLCTINAVVRNVNMGHLYTRN